jgi:hypothetical protein
MGHDNHYLYLNRFIDMKDINKKLDKIGKTKTSLSKKITIIILILLFLILLLIISI